MKKNREKEDEEDEEKFLSKINDSGRQASKEGKEKTILYDEEASSPLSGLARVVSQAFAD